MTLNVNTGVLQQELYRL